MNSKISPFPITIWLQTTYFQQNNNSISCWRLSAVSQQKFGDVADVICCGRVMRCVWYSFKKFFSFSLEIIFLLPMCKKSCQKESLFKIRVFKTHLLGHIACVYVNVYKALVRDYFLYLRVCKALINVYSLYLRVQLGYWKSSTRF